MSLPKSVKRYSLPTGAGVPINLVPDENGAIMYVKDAEKLLKGKNKNGGKSKKK